MNLNPINEEKEFQHNNIELLLRRMKYETYLHKSGWDIIQNDGYYVKGTFNFNQVLLHNAFEPTLPLMVIGAYLKPTGELFFHQMILDRVESGEYVVQNTLHSSVLDSSQNLPLLRIDRQKRYYGIFDKFNNSSGVINRPNGEFLLLTNEDSDSMNEEEWYLLPEAYSITLTPEPSITLTPELEFFS